MKKKNLAATLAIIAISAIPLMAQELAYNIDEELAKEVKASVQQEITQEQQTQNDAVIAAKYERLTNDFNAFIDLMKDKSLIKRTEEVAGQEIFVTIDDLAQSVLSLPQPTREGLISFLSNQSVRFAYQNNKKVNLKDLYELAKSLRTIHTFDTTPIVQFLQTEVPNNYINYVKLNEYDQEFIKLVNEKVNEVNSAIEHKLNDELNKVLEAQNAVNTYSKDKSDKYKAQVIWMAIDDLAQVILQLPEEERTDLCKELASENSSINLPELYKFAKDYVYYHNSAIEKVINTYYNENKPTQKTSWWQGVIETFQHEK